MDSHHTVLIAGLEPLMAEVRRVLAQHLVVFSAETLAQAQARLAIDPPDCVVLAYHFDDIRPFRLIHHIRDNRALNGLPITLVRVVPFRLGATHAEISHAYHAVGVTQYFDLHEEVRRLGAQTALERLSTAIRASLFPATVAGNARHKTGTAPSPRAGQRLARLAE